MKKHLLVFGIIFLFVSMGFQPAFETEEHYENNAGNAPTRT